SATGLLFRKVLAYLARVARRVAAAARDARGLVDALQGRHAASARHRNAQPRAAGAAGRCDHVARDPRVDPGRAEELRRPDLDGVGTELVAEPERRGVPPRAPDLVAEEAPSRRWPAATLRRRIDVRLRRLLAEQLGRQADDAAGLRDEPAEIG